MNTGLNAATANGDCETRAVFRSTTAIEKIADRESSRYALANMLVTKGNDDGTVFITATDGRRLCIVKERGTTDTAHYVPAKVIGKRGKKAVNVCINGAMTVRDEKDRSGATKVYSFQDLDLEYPNSPGRFPHVGQVLSRIPVKPVEEYGEYVEGDNEEWKTVICLTINTKMLMEMAEAMNGEEVDDDSKHVLKMFIETDSSRANVNNFVRCLSVDRSAIGMIGTLACDIPKGKSASDYEDGRRAFNARVDEYNQTFEQAFEYTESQRLMEEERARKKAEADKI